MSPAPTFQELKSVAELRMALRRFLLATDEVTKRHGLTPRQYDLLALLHSALPNEELTATVIAEQLGLSRSATTELLTRASKGGLLDRHGAEDDTRVKYVTPTREGRKRFFAAVEDLRSERNKILRLLRAATALAALLGAAI